MAEATFPRSGELEAAKTSRRSFLRSTGGLLAGSFFVIGRVPALILERAAAPMAGVRGAGTDAEADGFTIAERPRGIVQFDLATFSAYAGDRFYLRHGSNVTLNMNLARIERRRWHALGDASAPAMPISEVFSLIFLGPREPALPQGTYRLEHAALGPFDLFIVPMGAEDGGRRYEAAFSLLKA